MNNVRSINYFRRERDTASRQIAAEHEWVNTMQMQHASFTQRHLPICRVARKTRIRRAARAVLWLGVGVLAGFGLAGILVALYGIGVLLAALVS